MTLVLLIRHARCDPTGDSLAGRTPGVHLDATGQQQAAELSRALGAMRIDACYSSPLERAQETAAPIAAAQGVPVQTLDTLLEVDFGEFTGRRFPELEGDPRWRRWNAERSTARLPGGESMGEVVARASAALAHVRAAHPDGTVALVSHGDVIRAALASLLDLPLERSLRLAVSPASIAAARLWPDWAELLSLNWRAGGSLPG